MGLRGVSALPRVSSWVSPSPGMPWVTSSRSDTLHLSQGLGEGRTGQPCTLGSSCFLSFLKKYKTLEIHVLYDREKKVPNVPPQKTVYFVLCKVFIKMEEKNDVG